MVLRVPVCFERALRHDGNQLFDIQTKASRWAVAAKHGPHFVVAPTTHQRIAGLGHVSGKARAAVVGVPAQVGQIEGEIYPGELLGQILQILQHLPHGRCSFQGFFCLF